MAAHFSDIEKYIRLNLSNIVYSNFSDVILKGSICNDDYKKLFESSNGELFLVKTRRNSSTLIIDGTNLILTCLRNNEDSIDLLNRLNTLIINENVSNIIVYVKCLSSGNYVRYHRSSEWLINEFINSIRSFRIPPIEELNILNCFMDLLMNHSERIGADYLRTLIREFEFPCMDEFKSALINVIQIKLDESICFKEIIEGIDECKQIYDKMSPSGIQTLLDEYIHGRESDDDAYRVVFGTVIDMDKMVKSIKQLHIAKRDECKYATLLSYIDIYCKIMRKLNITRNIADC